MAGYRQRHQSIAVERRASLHVHGLQDASREIAVDFQGQLFRGRVFFGVACIDRSRPLSGSRAACPGCTGVSSGPQSIRTVWRAG